MIPMRFLSNMGVYTFDNIHGVRNVKVHVIDNEELAKTKVQEMKASALEYGHFPRHPLVGADHKPLTTPTAIRSNYHVLVLCRGDKCLVIHTNNAPKSTVMELFQDSSICVVRPQTTGRYQLADAVGKSVEIGVGVGPLAARVLKKQTLKNMSLADIAREVGVPYTTPGITGEGNIVVDGVQPIVLTDDLVKLIVSDAIASYQIGLKLLSSL